MVDNDALLEVLEQVRVVLSDHMQWLVLLFENQRGSWLVSKYLWNVKTESAAQLAGEIRNKLLKKLAIGEDPISKLFELFHEIDGDGSNELRWGVVVTRLHYAYKHI